MGRFGGSDSSPKQKNCSQAFAISDANHRKEFSLRGAAVRIYPLFSVVYYHNLGAFLEPSKQGAMRSLLSETEPSGSRLADIQRRIG
jgi:hypothetical protein